MVCDNPIQREGVSITGAFKILTIPVRNLTQLAAKEMEPAKPLLGAVRCLNLNLKLPFMDPSSPSIQYCNN